MALNNFSSDNPERGQLNQSTNQLSTAHPRVREPLDDHPLHADDLRHQLVEGVLGAEIVPETFHHLMID